MLIGSRRSLLGRRAAFVGVLDQIGIPAAAAYSTRLLRAAYAGKCLRVRRSSDNAESDIGFASNALDMSALLAFVGIGNGLVTKWYDQAGNGMDVSQSSASLQPPIVSSGTLVTFNGRPGITSLEAAGYILSSIASFSSGNFPSSTGSITSVVNLQPQSFGNDQYKLAQVNNSDLWDIFGGQMYYGDFYASRGNTSNPGQPTSGALIQTNVTDGTTYRHYRNGVLKISEAIGWGAFSVGTMHVLNGQGVGQNYAADAVGLEYIVLSANPSSPQRAILESNIATYYGISI
jgi:hypothetical protein